MEEMESLGRAARSRGRKTTSRNDGSTGNDLWGVQPDAKTTMMPRCTSLHFDGKQKGVVYLLAARCERTWSLVWDGDGFRYSGGLP
jgi:hypothetical protein